MFFNTPNYVKQALVMDSPQWKRVVAELGKAYPNDFAQIMKIIAKNQTFWMLGGSNNLSRPEHGIKRLATTMNYKIRQRLEKVADTLEKIALKALEAIAYALQLVMIDLVYGKSKYRKRDSQPRPIVHRTYNRTVVYRTLYTPRLPRPKERVYIVKTKE